MKKMLFDTKTVVKKHLQRTAKISWEKTLRDPRSRINRTWNFSYLMNILWFGMLSGCKNLREVEDFSECYRERVPDTTLRDIMVMISPEPLRAKLVQEVKKSLHEHELPKEDFPIRITVIDGKCISVSKGFVGDFSQKSECNDGVQYINRVLRAVHVSNETKLILGQQTICGKTSEMKEFIPFLKHLLEDYGKTSLFEVISVDAGMISQENAQFLIDNGLHYIMALKNPQKGLVKLGHKLLGNREVPDKITEEYVNGKCIIRKLYRCPAPEYPGWKHLTEFWRIQQETKDSKGKVTIENRYFITSISPQKLSERQVLQAIRMHWGIENNANWIFDTAWKEDDAPWCNKALIMVSYLRMLAYNVLSRLKTRRLRKKNDRERSWKGIMRLISNIILFIFNDFEPRDMSVLALE